MNKRRVACELVKIARELTSAKKSPREKAFDEILKVMHKQGLMKGPITDHGTSVDKKYRYIFFSVPRYLDGEVRVYGPKFIQVKWMFGRRRHSIVHRSVAEAVKFLKSNFAEWHLY